MRAETDPSAATSPNLKRRAFVGIATAAAAGGGTMHLAAATPATPRAIPEDDPRIVVERPALHDGRTTIDAYAARPKDASPSTPTVVLVMHLWGVDASIREVVRRLAADGFAAIAPDLYARFGPLDGDGTTDAKVFRPYANRLQRAQYVADLAAAQTWLSNRAPKTSSAVLGFCMGGRMAMEAAVDDPKRYAAVVPFYGAIDGIDPKAIAMPWCGSYGERDTGIPADAVRAFAAALTVPHDLRIYASAGHAFFDDHRPSYVASAAQDAWERTIAFLRRYLKAQP